MSSQGSQTYRLLDYMTLSVLYGVGSFISISLSGILSFFILKQKKQILELEQTEPLLPEELYEYITNKYKEKLSMLSRQKQDQFKIPGKFIVKGEVTSGQMFPSIDQKSGLIYQRMKIDKIYMHSNQQNQNVVEKRNELQDDKFLKFFEVVNPVIQATKRESLTRQCPLTKKITKAQTEFESNSLKCLITNYGTKKTNIESALKPISYVEKFNDTIKANLKIQAGTILIIGFTQNQIGIKIGDSIMVYGSIIFDVKRKLLKFDIPDVISKRKYDIQELVSRHFNLKSIASFLFFSLGVFYAYKATTAFIKHRKIVQKQYQSRQRAIDLEDSSW